MSIRLLPRLFTVAFCALAGCNSAPPPPAAPIAPTREAKVLPPLVEDLQQR
jgi:hypothetical protein